MKADNIRGANISDLVPEDANEFFDHQMAWGMIEANMQDLLMEWFECPDEAGYWFFQDFRFDWYDYSFELLDVDPEWNPTEEQLKKAFDFGFKRCWFNYTNGHELYCSNRDGEIHIGNHRQKNGTVI